MISRILFPTDFSRHSERALDTALSVAAEFGASLHMLHAVVLHSEDPHDPSHHFPDPDEIRQRLERAADRRMVSDLAQRQAAELDVTRVQRRGPAVGPVILEYADEIDADMIVMSTRGRRGLEHVLLGSVAEQVVRAAACPVLTVLSSDDAQPPGLHRPILVPVDFSAHSRDALSLAREIAARYGTSIDLLHVFERPIHPEVYLGGMPLDSPEFQTVEGSLREALETFAAETSGPDVRTDLHLREGRAVTGILEFAEESGSGLIVIASHGLTGLAHVLLGSVTEKIVRRARCPVLTARAFGKKLLE